MPQPVSSRLSESPNAKLQLQLCAFYIGEKGVRLVQYGSEVGGEICHSGWGKGDISASTQASSRKRREKTCFSICTPQEYTQIRSRESSKEVR